MMIGPIDYIRQVQDPVQMALQGYMGGQAVQQNRQNMAAQDQQMQMRETLFAQEQEQQQAQAQRAQQVQGILADFAERARTGNLTAEDVIQAQMQVPELAEEISKSYELLTTAQREGQIAELSQLAVAMRRNPELAMQMIDDRLIAAENENDPGEVAALRALKMQAEMDPSAPMSAILMELATVMDKDQFRNFMDVAMPQPTETFRPISPEEAAQIGLPSNSGYQVNTVTGEIKSVGREASPIVNINTGDGVPQRTEFERAVDQRIATDYADWVTGGGSDVLKQVGQLQVVKERLDRGEELSGPLLGLVPPNMRIMFNEKSVDSQQLVEEVVQRNLRLILGAQFTEREGERLIARAYNPQGSAELNSRRVGALIGQISLAAQQKQALFDHVEKFGTATGFRGTTPSMEDFFAALSAAEGGANVPKPMAEPDVNSLIERYGRK
jgi:hypothetical protein